MFSVFLLFYRYDRVQEEKDLEVVCYERQISELEDSMDELNRKQHQAEQERRESLRDQSEEGALKEDMNKLRIELEQERSMHLVSPPLAMLIDITMLWVDWNT